MKRLLLLLVLFLPRGSVNAAEPLRIGVAVPLSGSAAWLGESTLRGMELYFDLYPEAKNKMTLIVEDEGTGNTVQGVSAVKKLIEIDKAAMLVIQLSPVVNAAAPAIERARIPAIAIVADDVGKNRKFILKLWPAAENEAQANADHLDRRNLRRLVLVTSEQDGMLRRTSALRAKLTGQSSIILDEKLNAVDEIPAIASRAADASPDAVVMNLMPGQNGVFARKLRELNFKGPIIASVIASAKSEMQLAAGALSGAVYPDSSLSDEFVAAYLKKYHERPPAGAANSFDALLLAEKALAADPEARSNRQALNAALRHKEVSGALGRYSFSFDNLNEYRLPVSMQTID